MEKQYGLALSKIEDVEMMNMLRSEEGPPGCHPTNQLRCGGLDSMDWAEMLLRMYLRWGERNGYETKVVDILRDDEAGINLPPLS